MPRSCYRLAALASAALLVGVAPIRDVASAAADAPRVVGVVVDGAEVDPVNRAMLASLRDAMAERGWIDGHNLYLRAKYTGGHLEFLPERLEQMLVEDVAVLVSASNDVTVGILEATSDVPIVMAPNHDAALSGLVDDPTRPGGRVTGLSIPESSHWSTKLDVLAQLVPDLDRVAVLGDARSTASIARLERAAMTLAATGMAVRSYGFECAGDMYRALSDAVEEGTQALLLVEGVNTVEQNRYELAWHSADRRLPIVATDRAFAEAGLLMSLGPSRVELQDQVADYVVALLAGTPVVELPVQEVGADSPAINVGMLADLGISIPATLMAEAELVE